MKPDKQFSDVLKYFGTNAEAMEFFDYIDSDRFSDLAKSHCFIVDNIWLHQPPWQLPVLMADLQYDFAYLNYDGSTSVNMNAMAWHKSLMSAYVAKNSTNDMGLDIGLRMSTDGRVGIKIAIDGESWQPAQGCSAVVKPAYSYSIDPNGYEVIDGILCSKTQSYFNPCSIAKLTLSWANGETVQLLLAQICFDNGDKRYVFIRE